MGLALDPVRLGIGHPPEGHSQPCGRRGVIVRPPSPRCGTSRSCSPTLSESRTTGRGVAGRPAGFVGSDVESLADGSAALTSVAASSAATVLVTSFIDVAVSVGICWIPVLIPVDAKRSVWVGVSVDATGGETSAFPVSVAGGASADPPRCGGDRRGIARRQITRQLRARFASLALATAAASDAAFDVSRNSGSVGSVAITAFSRRACRCDHASSRE